MIWPPSCTDCENFGHGTVDCPQMIPVEDMPTLETIEDDCCSTPPPPPFGSITTPQDDIEDATDSDDESSMEKNEEWISMVGMVQETPTNLLDFNLIANSKSSKVK